jgi:hypothetical protein
VTPVRNENVSGKMLKLPPDGVQPLSPANTCVWMSTSPGVTYKPRTLTTLRACAAGMPEADGGNLPATNRHIANRVDVVLRVDHLAVLQQKIIRRLRV